MREGEGVGDEGGEGYDFLVEVKYILGRIWRVVKGKRSRAQNSPN